MNVHLHPPNPEEHRTIAHPAPPRGVSATVVVPREQALANARRALDAARAEDAADYRSGRMSPERRAIYERLLTVQPSREAR